MFFLIRMGGGRGNRVDREHRPSALALPRPPDVFFPFALALAQLARWGRHCRPRGRVFGVVEDFPGPHGLILAARTYRSDDNLSGGHDRSVCVRPLMGWCGLTVWEVQKTAI